LIVFEFPLFLALICLTIAILSTGSQLVTSCVVRGKKG
jgi:hypothetical protein